MCESDDYKRPGPTTGPGDAAAQREAARKAKAWAAADTIRQALIAHGFRLEDSKSATHAVSEFAEALRLPAVAVTLVRE